MGMMDTVTTWTRGIDVIEVAEGIRTRAEEAGPPPAVRGLRPGARQGFDRIVDALNRLPRPILTFGTLALLATAVVVPDWFTGRMEALSQLPEGLWWIVGAVLGLHFGARAQDKAQEAKREREQRHDAEGGEPGEQADDHPARQPRLPEHVRDHGADEGGRDEQHEGEAAAPLRAVDRGRGRRRARGRRAPG